MWVRRVQLVDVRSYRHAEVVLEPGVTVLLGANGQGKTNLVEAVVRAATGSSHRVAGDVPLVRVGADLGVIRLEVVTDAGRRRTLELEVGPGRTRTRVDGQDVRRATDALGVLRTVLFAPEDVAIVRGDPGERRRFLDDLLSQRRPAYAAARLEYDRVLRQRNNLLKQVRALDRGARAAAGGTLAAWTEQLVAHGTSLLAARHAAVHALAGPLDGAYRRLADRPEEVALTYAGSAGPDVPGRSGAGVPEPAPLAAAFRATLDELADDELQRGVTLAGPHRDDLELTIGGLPARTHSSQGEAWSLALALKLATIEVLTEVGDQPVLLLDDVFAELDASRRRQLAAVCEGHEQVIVTAAVAADVPLTGARIEVALDDQGTQLHARPQLAGGAA